MASDETNEDRPANDPAHIVPEVYRQRVADGLDHLEAYRTAVLTYRRICPGTDDAAATVAVSRILDEAGLTPAETMHREDR